MSTHRLLLALLALLVAPIAHGANILLVIGATTPEAAEADRITTFESWGHTVTTIQDSEPQANYDAAVVGIDVIYVPESIFSGDLSSKVRQVTASVVAEERGNNDDFGFSTSDGAGGTASSITITDNTHPITAGFPLGSLTISTSSSSQLNRLVPTQALGLQSLADDANSPGDPSVFLLEAGVTLANATGGNTLSRGRRVGLPMDQDFDWNNLNANGLLIVERAIAWAAVGNLDYLGGRWRFDETSGTTAVDSSGAEADGTLVGATRISDGVVNGAVAFAGNGSDRISLPHTVLDGADDITFATWFRATNATSNPTLISVANASNDNEFAVRILSSNQIAVYDGEGPFSREIWTLGFSITDGEWRHLVVVRDSATGEITLYLNGVEQGSESATLNPIEVDPGGLLLGVDQDSVGGNFETSESLNGALDEVALYRRTLTEEEIAVLASPTGLAGHWKFDETSGVTALDSSVWSKDGTLVDGPTRISNGLIDRAITLAADGADHVDLPSTVLDRAGDATITAWVRPEPSATRRAYFSGANASNNNEILLAVSDTTVAAYNGEDASSTSRIVWTLPRSIAGEWSHLAIVRDDVNNELSLYLNGELVGVQATTLNPLDIDLGGLVVGEDQDSVGGGFQASDSFAGSLDDLRVYRRVLSASEIEGIYGPLGRWRFDETSGATAADSSPNGYDLTAPATPTWVTDGVRQGAVDLTGTIFNGPGDIDESIGNTVGFAGWVRLSTAVADMASSTAEIVDMQRSSVNTGFDLSFRRTEQTLRFRVYDGAGPVNLTWDASSLEAGEWLHFAAAYDGAEMRLYINGQLAASVPNTAGLDIGSVTMMLGDDLDGALDDFVLYNRPMSAAEIGRHYGLIGHWRLDEASASVAADSSGLGNDGVYQGGALPGAAGPTLDAPTLAAEFNGVTGDRIALPAMDFDFSDGLAMAVWYRVDALDNTNGPYTDFFSLSNGSLVDDIWLGLDNTGGLDLFLSDTADGSDFHGLIEGAPPILGIWRHAVAVVDASGNATLYHDGVAVNSDFTSLPRRVSRASNGIGETTFVHTLDGRLHDARIYNRPITPEEVRALFFSQFAPGPRIIRWLEAANP